MKKIILTFIFINFLYSCKEEKTEYSSNGNIEKKYFIENNKLDGVYEEYYDNGKLKIKHIYENGEPKDSSIYYNENGAIIQIDYHVMKGVNFIQVYNNYKNKKISHEGNFSQNQKIGKWKYYDNLGKLKTIREYIDSCGTQYTNQGWRYDLNGKFTEEGSNCYFVKIKKKKFKTNEIIDLKIQYTPLFSKKSNSFICISPKIEKNFCNLKNERLDTIFSDNNNFEFKLSFSEKGNKNIRGFIKEGYFDKSKGKFGERTIYISIPFLIVE